MNRTTQSYIVTCISYCSSNSGKIKKNGSKKVGFPVHNILAAIANHVVEEYLNAMSKPNRLNKSCFEWEVASHPWLVMVEKIIGGKVKKKQKDISFPSIWPL